MKYYEKSWAILIGIDKYENPRVRHLKNAVNDARKLSAALQEKGYEHIIQLYNESATKESIISLLSDDDQLPGRVTKDDRLLLFFSGHGTSLKSKKGESIGYLVPYEGDVYRRNTLIEFIDFVRNCTRFIQAKHILFLLDCCFSGMSALRLVNTDNVMIPNMPTNDFIQSCLAKETVQIITAGGEDEEVLDGSIFTGHSPFTGTIIHGLDSGEADLLGDGILTATELGTYLTKRVSDVSNVYGHSQKPIFNRLPGDRGGDFIVTFSKNIVYESLDEYRKRLESLTPRQKVEMIREESGLHINSLVESNDTIAISYTNLQNEIKDFQTGILSLISILGRMYIPRSKYRISSRSVSVPSMIGRDIAEFVTAEISSDKVQKFLNKKINNKELWSSIIFFVKEPDINAIRKLKINFPLMV